MTQTWGVDYHLRVWPSPPSTGIVATGQLTKVDVAADATSETTAAIRVAARPEHPNAPASFVFDLSCEEASGQWQTDGVRIEC